MNIVDFESMNFAPEEFLIKVSLYKTPFTLEELIALFERQNTDTRNS